MLYRSVGASCRKAVFQDQISSGDLGRTNERNKEVA